MTDVSLASLHPTDYERIQQSWGPRCGIRRAHVCGCTVVHVTHTHTHICTLAQEHAQTLSGWLTCSSWLEHSLILLLSQMDSVFLFLSGVTSGGAHTHTHTLHILMYFCLPGREAAVWVLIPSVNLPLFIGHPCYWTHTQTSTQTHTQSSTLWSLKRNKGGQCQEWNQAAVSCEARVNPHFQGPETKRSLTVEMLRELRRNSSLLCHLIHPPPL